MPGRISRRWTFAAIAVPAAAACNAILGNSAAEYVGPDASIPGSEPQSDTGPPSYVDPGSCVEIAGGNWTACNGTDSCVLGPATTRLFRHFECGMSMFGKTASLRSVLKKTGVHASEAIYVGDQSVDLQAARRAGIAFGAVAWGYATIESLREHRPEEEFASVAELARIA